MWRQVKEMCCRRHFPMFNFNGHKLYETSTRVTTKLCVAFHFSRSRCCCGRIWICWKAPDERETEREWERERGAEMLGLRGGGGRTEVMNHIEAVCCANGIAKTKPQPTAVPFNYFWRVNRLAILFDGCVGAAPCSQRHFEWNLAYGWQMNEWNTLCERQVCQIAEQIKASRCRSGCKGHAFTNIDSNANTNPFEMLIRDFRPAIKAIAI